MSFAMPKRRLGTFDDEDARLIFEGRRAIARRKYKYALNTGKIQRKYFCERCGSGEAVEGHHLDLINQPLDVIWLCGTCHQSEHAKEAKGKSPLVFARIPEADFEKLKLLMPKESPSERVRQAIHGYIEVMT